MLIWGAGLFLLQPIHVGAQGVTNRNQPPAAKPAPSGRPFPVSFVDVAQNAGLDMKFTSGDEKAKKYIVETNGTGVAFLDYDNDGWQDIFLVNSSRLGGFPSSAPTNHLYRNDHNGKFTDVTQEAKLGRSGWGNGVCAGDTDNKGFDDLYVTYWGANVLYKNNGDGTFTDVTAKSGAGGNPKQWSSGCTFLDYDRDGYLDLLVTSYIDFDLSRTPLPGAAANCQWKGMPVLCGPRGLPFGRAVLYHNRGDGTFEDVTAVSGIGQVQGYYAFTAIAADLNRDGWVDIYIACDATPSIFFRNNRGRSFTDIAAETGVAFNEHGFEQSGMGVAAGDYDNDGWLDLIKTNFSGDYPNLYHNLGGGIFEDVVLKAGLAVNPQYVAWGVGFVDLDNDGLQDVFQVNGHIFPELDGRNGGESYRAPRLVYHNLGNGKFEDVSSKAGPGVAQRQSSRGAAFGDFDNDGDIDVLIMNMEAGPSLLRNDLRTENHWIQVKLQGTRSNRGAIGAQVTLQSGSLSQTSAVVSQSSYLSVNDSRLHFGLGKADRVDGFTVRWPSGGVENFAGSEANRLVRLIEGQGLK